MPPAPTFKWEVNVTTIVTVVVFIVTAAAGWNTLEQRGQVNREMIERTRVQVEALEARQRAMETTQARYDERHLNILQILGRIEARLDNREIPR